jgi:hypothetical protein
VSCGVIEYSLLSLGASGLVASGFGRTVGGRNFERTALPSPVSTGSAFAEATADLAKAQSAEAGQVPRVLSQSPLSLSGIPLAVL